MIGRSAEGGILLVGALHTSQIAFATGGTDGPIGVLSKGLHRRFEMYSVHM